MRDHQKSFVIPKSQPTPIQNPPPKKSLRFLKTFYPCLRGKASRIEVKPPGSCPENDTHCPLSSPFRPRRWHSQLSCHSSSPPPQGRTDCTASLGSAHKGVLAYGCPVFILQLPGCSMLSVSRGISSGPFTLPGTCCVSSSCYLPGVERAAPSVTPDLGSHSHGASALARVSSGVAFHTGSGGAAVVHGPTRPQHPALWPGCRHWAAGP